MQRNVYIQKSLYSTTQNPHDAWPPQKGVETETRRITAGRLGIWRVMKQNIIRGRATGGVETRNIYITYKKYTTLRRSHERYINCGILKAITSFEEVVFKVEDKQ